jgi:hypothetical protein
LRYLDTNYRRNIRLISETAATYLFEQLYSPRSNGKIARGFTMYLKYAARGDVVWISLAHYWAQMFFFLVNVVVDFGGHMREIC